MSDTIDIDDLLRQLMAGTPSRSYLLAIMPVVLDRLEAAEARVAALDDNLAQERELVLSLYDQNQEQHLRFAALEAAAVAAVAALHQANECSVCYGPVWKGEHEATCPIGALAALLEGG